MNEREPKRLAGGRLARALRDLGNAHAPTSLLHGALSRLRLGDLYGSFETPIGPVFVAYNREGIAAVRRAESAEDFERAFLERHGRPAYPVAELPASLVRSLRRQLAGQRTRLRFDLRGRSAFEREVLLAALGIPYGEVRPYGWLAHEIGRSGAARAVGSALGRNPVPLLIPCHRVVRENGGLGGYVFGPEAKRTLLEAEGVDLRSLEALAGARVRYYGSDTSRIYCFPTCRHARRVTPAHLVRFASEAQAAAAGYRPCKVCRPPQAV